ncbi:transglutaminase family protein [Sorangium sp. So ce542]
MGVMPTGSALVSVQVPSAPPAAITRWCGAPDASTSTPSAEPLRSRDVARYEFACPTKTAWEVFNERRGVCRDDAHLAIALCRCMNIPARYCTGYLGDIGVPPPHGPMDFSGWFEAYIGGQWHTFDARDNVPRIGRVPIARGRDAADVAISTTFGPNTLETFRVWTRSRVRPPSTSSSKLVPGLLGPGSPAASSHEGDTTAQPGTPLLRFGAASPPARPLTPERTSRP